MDKEKTKSLTSRALFIGFLVALLATCALVLSGCSSLSPTQVTQKFLDAVKAEDMNNVGDSYAGDSSEVMSLDENIVLDESSLSAEDAEKVKSMVNDNLLPKLREFDYELSNEVINGDKATVDAKITTYAVGDAFSSSISDFLDQAIALAFSGATEDDLTSLFITTFDSKISAMPKTYTSTVTIPLSKVDGKWEVDAIDSNSELLDAILGGLVSSVESTASTYGAL